VLSGGSRYLTFAQLAEHRALLEAFVARAGVAGMLGFIFGYAVLTALSVPGATLLTVTAGFLFGPWLGGLCALLGATCGAGAVFLAARAGLAGLVDRAGPQLQRLTARFREDSFSYLLSLRLVPLFPFWLVNLAAGATGMRLPSYLTATFFGIIPGALVYASIGAGLGTLIESGQQPDLYAILRPGILLPLIGLALLVLLPVSYRHWAAHRRTAP
jgi:uncharacterized membrane protein YdjX (TVP38/TMEM64 family)